MLEQILRFPTAPFQEDAVSEFVRRRLDRLNVRFRIDRHGNIIARLRAGRPRAPALALVAHMDHPGFVAETSVRSSAGASAASMVRILGGVGDRLIGRRIRFFTVPETVGLITAPAKRDRTRKLTHVRVRTDVAVPPGTFGMWDLPPFRRTGTKIHARAIDDVCGVAVMLGVLDRLKKKTPGVIDLYCCFTRAEEVGFIGAAALAHQGILPRTARIISIEMSKELPGRADQGKGFVIRVGDRATIFDPDLIGFMIRSARQLRGAKKKFRFQTAILDGGTCEATLFGAMGYRAAGVALPLRNYHNRTPTLGVGLECIDLGDLENLVDFLSDLPGRMKTWGNYETALKARLERNFRTWKKFL